MLNRYVFPISTLFGSSVTVAESGFPAARLLNITLNAVPSLAFNDPDASLTVMLVAVTVPVFFTVMMNDASGLAPLVLTTPTSVTVISATADPDMVIDIFTSRS